MKQHTRLISVAIAGMLLMGVAVMALCAVRGLLDARGYVVPAIAFGISFFVLVGSTYGPANKLVLHETRRLQPPRLAQHMEQ